MGLRRWWESTAATLLVCAFAATAAAQHRPANALNWAFGGTVHTVARAGNVAFVGGRFNAVAARHNVVGGFAVISATTSHRALRTARVHGNVNAVVSDGTGGWFVGGNFTFVGPERRPQIVHILSDGRIDSAWTGRVDGRVMALALVGTTLFVGGEFTQAGSGVGGGLPAARQNLAAFAAADGALLPAVAAGADGVVLGFAAFGTTLYAGGEFTTFLGASRAHLAAVDTASDTVTAWNPGADGAIRALLPSADGATVYAGGRFANAGGAARANLAQIDATTGAATRFDPGANEAVLALALRGDVLYAGGRFTTLGGSARSHAGAVHATTGVVQSWDSERRRHRERHRRVGRRRLPRRRVPQRRRPRPAACRARQRRQRGARAVAPGPERSGAGDGRRSASGSRSADRSRRWAPIRAATLPPSTSRPGGCCRGIRGPTARCSPSRWAAIAGFTSAAPSRPSPGRRGRGSPRSICRRTRWRRGIPARTRPCWRSIRSPTAAA